MSKTANRTEVEPPTITTTDNGANPKIETAAKLSDKNAPAKPPKSIPREYFESFVVTLIMAFFGMTFIVQAVTVPTGSMQNTINIGDHFLVNKFIFAPGPKLPFLPMRDIRRGDVIVFKYPGNPKHPEQNTISGYVPYQTNYIKRVIGLPGETVEFRNNQVFIDGNLLPEHRFVTDDPTPSSAINAKEFEPRPPDASYKVYYSEETMQKAQKNALDKRGFEYGVAGKTMKVPDNSYFVMGDNRDNSGDSRVWGFVPRELVVGKAMFIYWSCEHTEDNSGFFQCLTHPRFSRIGTFIK